MSNEIDYQGTPCENLTVAADSDDELVRRIASATKGRRVRNVSHTTAQDGDKQKHVAHIIVESRRILTEG